MTTNPDTLMQCPPRGGLTRGATWLRAWHASHAKFLGGSIVLLIGSIFVSLANFGYNIGVARMLGAADFSHAAAAVTILMLVSALTLAFQLVCTKLVAKEETVEGKASVYQRLRKRAWTIGIGLGVFMLLASSVLTSYLRLSSPWIIILLAIGLTIYVPLGVKRGGLQGTCRFQRTKLEHGGRGHHQICGGDGPHRTRLRRFGRGGCNFGFGGLRLLLAG